jgi:hypothetical protein
LSDRQALLPQNRDSNPGISQACETLQQMFYRQKISDSSSKKMLNPDNKRFFRQKSAGRRQIQFIGALQMLDKKTLVFFRPANAGTM